jgi:Family of unknown function (DUF6011)
MTAFPAKMPADDFDDDISDLIGGAPREQKPRSASFVPATERIFTEPCHKCHGSGRFVGYSGRTLGACFTCNGTGKLTFKTAPEQRAKARTSAATRKSAKATERLNELVVQIDAFKADYPEIHTWMHDEAARFPFANEMLIALRKYGSLTPNQLAACRKCVDGRKRAQEARVAREQSAPEINISKIEEAFAKASKSLKKPKLHLDAFTIKHAGANSKNAGALYVTEGEEYLGKIVGGKFLSVKSCGDERQARVIEAAADPQAATIRYGRLTGHCGCCGRMLVDPVSVARGIGPICAERYGW